MNLTPSPEAGACVEGADARSWPPWVACRDLGPPISSARFIRQWAGQRVRLAQLILYFPQANSNRNQAQTLSRFPIQTALEEELWAVWGTTSRLLYPSV